ncbi:uncharacterized protein BP01DRAFT_306267 [Aspergillus saccharolyticus JOP 1030-1]|uniref:Zn(2)-C6 fungal-type domain-containing protein n=1 Tax=Aspergillus saccharolyticus JOP 1030-1 TaxID=1450539 RepID=A0A319A165_9EURO|nr:hypothetical protein BP01DRAFT_306267 [Aspergillus saccharolyticus JOP 1030-1]PYH41252.1 hypothetical protein BP01DRAFT_306267 [Aspergillus saccharolyticus JOP 1030-1]
MPPLRRKNGRQPACEPCRRRKLACDHELPACRRCQRLSMDCFYLANPLTKAKPISESGETPSESSIPSDSSAMPRAKTCPGAESTTPIIESSAEYLGPASFTSVFVEHRERFEVDNTLTSSGAGATGYLDRQSPVQQETNSITPNLLQLGVQILRNIPDEEACNLLLVKREFSMDACFRLANWQGSKLTWDEYRPVLNARTNENMLQLATRLSKCTMIPLPSEQDPSRWIESFSGSKARWEFVGLLFTYWSYGCVSLTPDSKAIASYCAGRTIKGAKQMMLHFKKCAAMCIEMCSELGGINVLFVHLLYKHNIMESNVSGDKSLSCWRQHGDTIAVTTSIGLHREPVSEWNEVSFQHELKRRLYSAIFAFDKVASTLTGRPPLLSRRYSTTQLPLDISDRDMLSGNVRAAAAKLDADGWDRNSGRSFNQAAMLRARAMFARNREEILEVLESSLDQISDSAIATCFDLKAQAAAIYAKLPEGLVHKVEDIDDLDIPGHCIHARILVHLEYLLNMFMLERLLTRHKIVTEQALMGVSQETLSLTLLYWKHKNRFMGLHNDFSWLAMSYGAPCSGILCLELLRQTSNPQAYNLELPRSETIQKLSLFVAFLDWLKPSGSDISAKAQIKNILQRSLDRILAMPASLCSPTIAMDDFGMHDFIGAEYPHLELLNTFNWVDWDGGV